GEGDVNAYVEYLGSHGTLEAATRHAEELAAQNHDNQYTVFQAVKTVATVRRTEAVWTINR
ncbi:MULTISPECIES: hypothetical protein, partial [unclassified Parvimonas]